MAVFAMIAAFVVISLIHAYRPQGVTLRIAAQLT
jgi:hypothetical protein